MNVMKTLREKWPVTLIAFALGLALIGVISCQLLFTVLLIFTLHMVNSKLGLHYKFFNEFDENSTKHGGELVAEVLKSHGVQFLFTLTGGHISPILVAAEKCGIKVVDTRQEVTAVFAADAVARLTGTVGAAVVTAGPGLTNTVTAIKNAQMAESPLLLIGGAAASLLKGRGALQDIDQISLFKSLCKLTCSVTKVRDIVPKLREAICVAQSGTPGPVFVELPIDVLYPYSLIKREMAHKGEAKSFTQKIGKWYIENYLRNLFANAFIPRDVSPLPVEIQRVSIKDLLDSVQLVRNAKRPLILVGSQATLPPIPATQVGEALSKLGIPCFLGGMARGLLGKDSDIQVRQERKEALKEADLVILAGSVCDFRLGYGRVLSRRSKVIAINRNKEQLFKNSDMFWTPTIAIQADVGSCLIDLIKSLGTYQCDKNWIQTLKNRDQSKESKISTMAEEKMEQHLNPVKIFCELEGVLEDNTILVADGGDFVGTAAYILRPRNPLGWLDPGAFGTLGVGAGFAIGAKLVRPEMNVVIIYGDGSAGYSIIEYDTYRRFKLPILSIIGNDAGWTQIAREQVPLFNSTVACQLEYSDYHLIAEALGAKGILMGSPEEGAVTAIFLEAFNELKKGRSILINALIGKTKFREGSISV